MLVALDTPVFPGNDAFEECAMMFFFMLSIFAFLAMFLHVRPRSPDVLISKQKYAAFLLSVNQKTQRLLRMLF